MKRRQLSIEVPDYDSQVSGILEVPEKSFCLLVLAHGAGAGMQHPWIEYLAQALHQQRIATLRYQFMYMEAKKRRPDPPKAAVAAVIAAIDKAKSLCPDLPLFAGGKSFGSRMTTTAASLGAVSKVRGLICFGFPLHPANKPSVSRAEHLEHVEIPTLFIQGTRDALAELTRMKQVVAQKPKRFSLHIVEGADHAFHVLKSSGRSDTDVLTEIAEACQCFGARNR